MDDISVVPNDFQLEPGQDLVLRSSNGTERLRFDAETGTIRIRSAGGDVIIRVDPDNRNILLGGFGGDGDLLVFPRSATNHNTSSASIHISGDDPLVRIGQESKGGKLSVGGPGHLIEFQGDDGRILLSEGVMRLQDSTGRSRLVLNGRSANVVFGGNGEDGEIEIKDANGNRTIFLNGDTANAAFGTSGNAGAVFIKDDSGENAIVLNGATANVALGRDGNAGDLFLKDESGENAIVLNGAKANVTLGRDGNGGDLFLKDDSGGDAIVLRGTTGNIGVGRNGRAGNVFVKNDEGENTIHMSGQTGDILIQNADCAEQFDVLDEAELEPGDVMIIGEEGGLLRSYQAYDRRVAGIISGAGNYRPGIVLDQRATDRLRKPLALVGKVYCKVDANYGAIRVGDLLTSSKTAGHAMRAGDPARAFGAVIGKSLGNLDTGLGMVPVLVCLQ